MVGKGLRRVSNGYHYFFVKPGRSGNVHKVAERLMAIDNVKEVAITEGDYGFVVKAGQDSRVIEGITKAVGGKTSKAVCYCQYVRS